MRCEICGVEFPNSVELEKHREQVHPLGDDEENLEKPDLLQEEEEQAPARS